MEAATATMTEMADPRDEPEDVFVREVEASLPEGGDRTATMLRLDYLLQRIREEEARASEVAEFTTRRVAMITEHGQNQIRTIENRVRWLKSKVLAHMPTTGEGMQREFGKKSVSLPHGRVGFRQTPPTVVIEDMDKAVEWARRHGIETKVEESVAKPAVLAWVKRTGAVPDTPAIEYVDGYEKVYVEPAKEGR